MFVNEHILIALTFVTSIITFHSQNNIVIIKLSHSEPVFNNTTLILRLNDDFVYQSFYLLNHFQMLMKKWQTKYAFNIFKANFVLISMWRVFVIYKLLLRLNVSKWDCVMKNKITRQFACTSALVLSLKMCIVKKRNVRCYVF